MCERRVYVAYGTMSNEHIGVLYKVWYLIAFKLEDDFIRVNVYANWRPFYKKYGALLIFRSPTPETVVTPLLQYLIADNTFEKVSFSGLASVWNA